jgi:thioredoxin reductase (NADPH)
MYDLIIIGSGPAGLGAAVYGRRAGLSTLVIEKNPMSGGQVLNTYEVDNYLGLPGMNGFDMGMKFREHAEKMEAKFMEADVSGIEDNGDYKTVLTSEGELQGRSVIIASGATHSHLGVPGEEELSGMGVSYCATCDGAFFRGKDVAVVGGGDVAVEDAIFLARICRKVYLIHRRDSLRAARSLQKAMMAMENVEICWDSVVESINGEDGVTDISVRSKKTGELEKLEVQGVFIAVGIRPNSEPFVGNIAADERGYLIAGEDCATSMPGVFAAGDIRTKKLRQIVTAVADGANAVEGAQEFLTNLL